VKALAVAALAVLAGCFDFKGLSAGGDPSARDLASVDGPADLPDPCATAIACQGFEGPLAPSWFFDGQLGATLQARASAAHDGALGLFARTAGMAANQYATASFPLAASAGPLHLRFWTRVAALPAATFTLIGMIEAAGETTSIGVTGDGRWSVSTRDGTGDDVTSGLSVSPGWHCVRLSVSLDDGSGSARLDAEAPFAWPATARMTVTQVKVGVARGGTLEATSVEVDDVVISTQPVPCD
jgi:hypothetical protein